MIIKKIYLVFFRWLSRYILFCFGNLIVFKNLYVFVIKFCSVRFFLILREVIIRIFVIIVYLFNILLVLGFVICNIIFCLFVMIIRNLKFMWVSGFEFVCYYILYDMFDIFGVWVICIVVNGCFVNYIVCCVICLLIYIDCFYFFSYILC